MKIARMIYTSLTLIWMLVIFAFSAQDADNSTGASSGFSASIVRFVVRDFDTWSEDRQQELLEKMSLPVRKCAHATEYAILGFLWYGLLASYGISGRRRLFTAIMAGVLYAASDEFHQLFVPGRSGQLTDVLLDGLGVCVGCILALRMYSFVNKKRQIR